MKRTKGGKRKLAIIELSLSLLGLVAILAIYIYLPNLSDLLDPPAYQLTEQQKAEGYDRTCSGGRKGCTIDDVAYRFLTETEYSSDASCLTSDSWCIYAIPLKADCTEVVVEAHTSETDGLLSSSVETFERHFKPQNGRFIEPGEKVTIGFPSYNNKSEYLAINAVYCYGSG